MRENPYKRLPPIERKPDGSLYRMTPAQRKQANSLIRRECCCYEDGKATPGFVSANSTQMGLMSNSPNRIRASSAAQIGRAHV